MGCNRSGVTAHDQHVDHIWELDAGVDLEREMYGRHLSRSLPTGDRAPRSLFDPFWGLTNEERREAAQAWYEHHRSCAYCWGDTRVYRDGESVRVPPPGLSETEEVSRG